MNIDLSLVLTIFLINVAHVSLSTVRTMLTMKGYTVIAPIVSMVEVTIYIFGLGLVLDNLDNYWNIAAYAIGFATGILCGIKIEDRLALGYILVSAIIPTTESHVPNQLRNLGYGVTTSHAHGREGDRLVLEVLTPRKSERKLYRQIEDLEPKAFVISYEPKYINGGFWTKKVRRNRARIKENAVQQEVQ